MGIVGVLIACRRIHFVHDVATGSIAFTWRPWTRCDYVRVVSVAAQHCVFRSEIWY
jgi:hypothetical protein